jgi:alpha-ketoglutarate-dependent taurine dioxygenase
MADAIVPDTQHRGLVAALPPAVRNYALLARMEGLNAIYTLDTRLTQMRFGRTFEVTGDHDWKPTDMVIWDNWRVLHAVEGCDPKYERRMQRTTIKGDYGLGYFEGGKKIGEVNREIAPLDLPA